MKLDDLSKKIINIVFAAGEGIETSDIAKILNLKKEEVESSFLEIKNNLNNVGLELIFTKNNNGHFLSITTKVEYTDILNGYFKINLEEDLTPAQLQTLTIVAYLVEVSVQEVSFIRGVQSIQTLRALSTRGLVKKIGERYVLTLDSFKILGIASSLDLKDFQKISENLKSKLSEALNG